jgi:hypothetical protein
MNMRFMWGLVGVVLLGSIPATGVMAGQGPVQVQVVLDDGDRMRQFPLQSRRHGKVYRAYVEARKERNYSLRVRNRTDGRIGVVIAVDGRNIISGKKSHLSPKERMYILDARETAEFSGWRTGRDRVNRFYFTDSADSYAEAFSDRSAMGVIAVAAYREIVRKARPYYERRSRPDMMEQKSQPGTGYGDSEWSPSRKVEFEPRREAFAKSFLKYEWRKTLCRRGLMECRDRRPDNRFWPEEDDGYAPPPPGYRNDHWRDNFNRWMYQDQYH